MTAESPLTRGRHRMVALQRLTERRRMTCSRHPSLQLAARCLRPPGGLRATVSRFYLVKHALGREGCRHDILQSAVPLVITFSFLTRL